VLGFSSILRLSSSSIIKSREPNESKRFLVNPENVLIISELAVVELHSSLARRFRIGDISPDAQAEALKNFEEDCVRRFIVEPLRSPVLQKAKALLLTYGNTKALRSLDSLQLGACLTVHEQGPLVFVCADERLGEIAQQEGLQTLNPENPSAS
jgi:hypothetical protein